MNPLQLLMALRARAAGASGPGAGPAGPPPGGPSGPPPGSQGNGGGFEQIVGQMIDLGVQAMKSAPDAVDASGMAKIVATLHQFQAQVQQDNDAAMGAGPAVRAMRRATAARQG